MRKKLLIGAAIILTATSVFVFMTIFRAKGSELIGGKEEENDMYDGAEQAARFEFERTKDPATGTVPQERLLPAIEQTLKSKAEVERKMLAAMRSKKGVRAELAPQALTWQERGPSFDSVGPSNGNARANNGVTAGRIRAMLVDAGDPSGKTVWVGGVAGGLWKTNDITSPQPAWVVVNDFLSNLSVGDIFQQPGNPNIMYFASGEGYFGDPEMVRGNGVFKSDDHGVTWIQLPSTAAFASCNRIAGDAVGNLYVGTELNGVQRSTDAGATWTVITPTGSSSSIADLELSSTGRLHITTGLGTSFDGMYRFTDTPTTVSAGTWTSPTTPFPYPSGDNCRVELGVSGSTLFALPTDTIAQVPTIYRSADGGATWTPTSAQPASGTWANGQGWYDLSVAINPADPNQVIVGGLDNYKSTDGGNSWTQISEWITQTPTGQYVHADQQKAIWYDGGNKLLFASDGGVFYSADGGTTIRDRNIGLRLKQFYSVAIHPTAINYLLGGTQDNGTHQLNDFGLSSSVEVTGGDGGFVAIDQNEPQFQFGSYIANQYRRSVDGGANWEQVNFSFLGRFINPFDYDNTANNMYCGDDFSSYRRWLNAPATNTSTAITVSNMPGYVTAVAVSPYTTNRVYFGNTRGKIYRVDNADTFVSGTAATDLSGGLPTGFVTVSNISFGTDENNLLMCESNYGINNVWVSTNGGTTWTAIDGNLPDMPVRWTMFKPGENTKAYIATETGVWETSLINGASTVWIANTTFPTVRTDMIKYRPGDGTIAAAAHGRGLWTAMLAPSAASVTVSGRVLTSDGRGLRSAVVTITNANGISKNVTTGAFGYYRFDDLETGQTYVVTVRSKRFNYEPRVIVLTDELADYDITPTGSGSRVQMVMLRQK